MQSRLSCQSGIDSGPPRLGHETNGTEYFASLDINEKPTFCKERKKRSARMHFAESVIFTPI